MGTVRGSRTLGAPPERVWDVIDDPHHNPRWWPGVKRMEGVRDGHWTEVYVTRKRHTVRIDYRLLDSEPPGAQAAGRRSWEQEVVGSPFERVLRASVTEVRVQAAGEGSKVTIEERQKLRGYSRLVGPMLRRAARTRLEQALDGLERTCG